MPRSGAAAWKPLLSPLRIPEGRVGHHEIVHESHGPGWTTDTAPARAAIFGGQPRRAVSFPCETRWHRLRSSKHGTWMTDVPCEHAQMRACCANLFGDVLVAGLGLGLAVHLLARKRRVTSVTVVELSGEVIDLVWDHTDHRGKGVVIQADAFDFLRSERGKAYDSALLDTWQGDNEATFFKTVLPMRRLAAKRVRGPITAWNEDVMRGQLAYGLWTRALFLTRPELRQASGVDEAAVAKLTEPQGDVFHDWSVPFFRRLLRSREPVPDDQLQQLAAEHACALA